MLVTLRVKRINRQLQIILTKVNLKQWKKFEEGIFKNWKFYPEALNLFNYGLDLHLFMNFFTKKIPLRTTWLTLFSCLIYGRKYFSTRNNKFHLTYIKSNSDGNFSHSELCFAVLCLDYMEKYWPLFRGSLKRTDKCLIKRTKIDRTLIKNRVVASFLTCWKPVP